MVLVAHWSSAAVTDITPWMRFSRLPSKWHLSTIHLRPGTKESTMQKTVCTIHVSTTQLFCSTKNAIIST
jgi:hypothetical protein